MAKGKEKGKEKDAKGAAGGDEGPDVEAEFEVLLTSKNLELAEAKAKAERLTAGLDTLRAEHTVRPCPAWLGWWMASPDAHVASETHWMQLDYAVIGLSV
jgi:hypothetical protein